MLMVQCCRAKENVYPEPSLKMQLSLCKSGVLPTEFPKSIVSVVRLYIQ